VPVSLSRPSPAVEQFISVCERERARGGRRMAIFYVGCMYE